MPASSRCMQGGLVVDTARRGTSQAKAPPYFAHESAYVDDGAEVGAGTKIWHFSHVMKGARIGERCVIGQNVNVDGGTVIGNNVKIQNNVSVYTGVVIEDDVFLGPSCVLTNVTNPRGPGEPARALRNHDPEARLHPRRQRHDRLRGDIGRYAFVAAGSVVTKDVPDYALVLGNPARQGVDEPARAPAPESRCGGMMRCPESGFRYQETQPGVSCAAWTWTEEAPLARGAQQEVPSPTKQLKERK